MSFKIGKILSNTRPQRVSGRKLIVSPTTGKIVITEETCSALGVSDGDYLRIIASQEGDVYITKGEPSSEDSLQKGAKLSRIGNSNSLNSSQKSAWLELKGSNDHNVIYSVSEDAEYSDEVGENPCFRVEEPKIKPKVKRGSKDGEEDESED